MPKELQCRWERYLSLQWSNVLTAFKCPIGYVNHTTAVNWAALQRACSVAAAEFDCILFHATTDVARSLSVRVRVLGVDTLQDLPFYTAVIVISYTISWEGKTSPWSLQEKVVNDKARAEGVAGAVNVNSCVVSIFEMRKNMWPFTVRRLPEVAEPRGDARNWSVMR